MTPLDVAFVAVTAVPLEVTVAFHEFVMAWLPPQVQVTFHVLVATVPVLLTVTLALKPLPQLLLMAYVAEHLADPEPVPTGVGEAVCTAVAVGEAGRTAVAVGEAVALAVRVGDGVALPPPAALNE